MRITFGTHQTTGFVVWGFWQKQMWDQASAGALAEQDWSLTDAGRRYVQLMREWDTDLTATVGKDGTIRFTGFWEHMPSRRVIGHTAPKSAARRPRAIALEQ